MKRTFLPVCVTSFLLICATTVAFGQSGVSINDAGTAPDADAILDISSSTKGVLLPRVANHTTLTPDANSDYGLAVFNTTTNSYWFWDGTTWQEIPTVANTGNTLDEAYDEGGPGAGRIINATNGNVEIQGAGHLTVAANVGIGITTPAEDLHVEGSVLVDLYSQGAGAGVFFREGFTSSNQYNLGLLVHDDGDGSPDALDIAAWDGIYFNTGSNARNPRMVVAGSGNVGIGNMTPDRKMKISGTGWTALEVENTDNQDAAIELTSQSVSNYVFTDNTGFLGLESASGQPIAFRTNGANERMVVQSDGRVRVNNLAEPLGAVVTSNSAGVLGKTPLTNDPDDVLLGTGVFGSSSVFDDQDWYQVGSTNTPTAITDYIHTEGHVGIGTNFGPSETSPSSPLQVTASGSGNPNTNSIMAYNPINLGGNDAIITARVAGSNAGDPFISLDIANEFGWSMGIDNDHDNRFKIAPSWSNLSAGTAVTIQTDGNVGIGTVTPDANLNVGSSTGASIYLTREDANTTTGEVLGSLLFDSTDDTGPSTNDASAGIRAYASQDHGNSNKGAHLGFFTKNNVASGSGATERLRITSSGNVGIGTSSPSSIVHVSTSQVGNVSKLHNPTLGNGSLVGHEFGKNNSTNNMAEFRYNHISDGNAGNWINLGLWGNANTLNVVGTGNVGIGTTGPSQKLEVAGNTRITGLGGSGDRIVYTNNNGDLYASTGIPGGDNDYIQNQNGFDQGANYRISGQGQANTFVATANGNWYLRGGDDHELRDVNVANTMGVWGRQNSDRAGIQLGSDGSYIFGDNGNIGIGNTGPAFKLHVSGDIHPDGKFVVQNGVDGGSGRGIWMWTAGDSNWGIYMGQAGGGRSLSGGTATWGGGFGNHAIRFRTYNSSGNGFIFENSSEQSLMSIRSSNGRTTFRGALQLDCIGCGSTTSVDGDGSSNWGTMTIQGRVLSANSNIHLSPPSGYGVIINDDYRAAGGSGGGETYLDVDGRVDARGGLRTQKSYKFRTHRIGGNSTADINLGSWDLCALAGMYIDNYDGWDDDSRQMCEVYPWPGTPSYGSENVTRDFNFTEGYTTRRGWWLYMRAHEDGAQATQCSSICINLDY